MGLGGGDEEDEEEVVFTRPAGMTDTPTTTTTAAPAAADPTAAAQAATSPGAVLVPPAAAASPVPRGRPGAASLAAAARAEVEAALNMAILLSLRDNRPVATAAGGEQPTAANPTVPAAVAAAPSEADIAQLEGMGFPRADAVAALQATGNDVARAADRLLGAG